MSESDVSSALSGEEDDIVSLEGDIRFIADPVDDTSEHDPCQQVTVHVDTDRRLHTGRHGGVDLAMEPSFRRDVDEFRTDTQDEVFFCQFDFITIILCFIDFGDMVAEIGFLVSSFDVALLGSFSGSFFLYGSFELLLFFVPLLQIQFLIRRIDDFSVVEDL